MGQLSGNAIVRMDGKSLRVKDAEIELGGFERESKMADMKRVGFTKKPMPGLIKGTIIHGKDTPLRAIAAAEAVTISFTTDTGDAFVLRDACCTKVVKLKSDGEAEVEFEGTLV